MIVHGLDAVAGTLHQMCAVLERMTERCDPNTYYHRVRPYMFGWKNNPELPDGMVYTGVEAYGGRPQQFRGETGAQSAVIYAVDGFLGIEHGYDEMRAYLMEMRDYMPVQDRRFIEVVEQGPSVRGICPGTKERPARGKKSIQRRRGSAVRIPATAHRVRGDVRAQAGTAGKQGSCRYGRHALHRIFEKAHRRDPGSPHLAAIQPNQLLSTPVRVKLAYR